MGGPVLSVASRVGFDYCDGGGRRRCASGSIGLDIAACVLDKYWASGSSIVVKLPLASDPDQKRTFAVSTWKWTAGRLYVCSVQLSAFTRHGQPIG